MRYLVLVISSLMISLLLGCSPKKPTQPQPAENGNRKSPIVIASVKDNGTYIKVVYGQPYRNGRTILVSGKNMVKYGELAQMKPLKSP